MGATTSVAAIPQPLVELGTIRRLGAEVVEYPVGETDAIAGRRVRELGLPRDALLNVLVRGEQAIPPRGSTTIEAGDRLHILVRQEAAMEMEPLLRMWKEGPIGPPPRPPRTLRGTTPIYTVRPWRFGPDREEPSHPAMIGGIEVIDQLRTRRDGTPGAVVVLADGRYAFTGPTVAIGSAGRVQDAARERLERTDDESEKTWWREVIGSLAAPEES